MLKATINVKFKPRYYILTALLRITKSKTLYRYFLEDINNSIHKYATIQTKI